MLYYIQEDMMNEMITSRQGASELKIGYSTYTDWCRRLGFSKTGNAFILTRRKLGMIADSVYREGKRLPKSSYPDGA